MQEYNALFKTPRLNNKKITHGECNDAFIRDSFAIKAIFAEDLESIRR